jgi:hypothetical protein
MTMNFPRMILQLLLTIISMSACSSETEETATPVMYEPLIAASHASVGAKDAPAEANLAITRVALQNIAVPLKLVTIERRGAQAAIFKTGKNGDVETWSSQDKKSISMRNGIIVATRGLGRGSDVCRSAERRAVAARKRDAFARSHLLGWRG